jgi:hypothetical protein
MLLGRTGTLALKRRTAATGHVATEMPARSAQVVR